MSPKSKKKQRLNRSEAAVLYIVTKAKIKNLNMAGIQALLYLAQAYAVEMGRKQFIYRWTKEEQGPWSIAVERAVKSLVKKGLLKMVRRDP